MPTSTAVLTAVRERFERLQLDAPKVQQDVEQALALYERAKAAHDAHRSEMRELADFLHGEGFRVAAPPTTSNVAMSANMQILMCAKSILSDGKPRPTRELHEEMLRQGQIFTAVNAAQRLSQLLSGSEWFVSDRARGWMLAKSEDPAGAGSSGATQSLAGTHVGALTGEKENNHE